MGRRTTARRRRSARHCRAERPAADGDPRRAGTNGRLHARQGRHDAVHPWIDGDLLDAPPFRAPLAALPLVVGTNTNEMELFRDQVPALPEDVAVSFFARKASSLGIADKARVQAGLRGCGGDLVEAVADLDLHVPKEPIAHTHEPRGTPSGVPVHWEAPARRACHTLDLPFTFGTLDVGGWRGSRVPALPAADKLSTTLRTAWTSFARAVGRRTTDAGSWPRARRSCTSAVPARRAATPCADRVPAWLGAE